MKILRTVAELRAWRDEQHVAGTKVGFVPTMGYLHEGHLSLVHEAARRLEGQKGEVMLSIFVNPTQFAAGEDLDVYPRDEEGDLAKAKEAGATVAFCPLDNQEMYSPGPDVFVRVEKVDQLLCGGSRPTHFRGVTTVVSKLWNLVEPDFAVFGEKDWQQLALIRRMHKEMFFRGEVVGMPIVREADGLAMSSRNAYLTGDERIRARALNQFLATVRERFAGGEREGGALLAGAEEALAVGTIDYVTLADAETLESIERVDRRAVVALAVKFTQARLLDNTVLDPASL
jgi:pantoate--beta-alanine ligase